MGFGYSFRDGDWPRLRQIIQKLSSLNVGPESTPTFASLTITGDLSVGGDGTFDNLIIADDGWIGSVTTNQSIQIEADGDIVMSQDLAVDGDSINFDSGALVITDDDAATSNVFLTTNKDKMRFVIPDEVGVFGWQFVVGSVSLADLTKSGRLRFFGNQIAINFGEKETDNELSIFRSALSKKTDVALYTDGSLSWALGQTDSGNFGDGTQFYIGQTLGGPNPSMIIESDKTVEFFNDVTVTDSTLTAEQLTSTDDITMQGELLTLGSGAVADVVSQWVSNSGTGTLTWFDASQEWEFDGGDLTITGGGIFTGDDSQIGGDLTVCGDIILSTDGAAANLALSFASSGGTGRITWLDSSQVLQFEMVKATFVGDIDVEGDALIESEVIGPKYKLTLIGGMAVLLTNESGGVSVAGDIVMASTGTVDAVDIAGADGLNSIGVFLDSGVAESAEAWIVVSGIADVHIDAGGCVLGDRIITGAPAGRGTVSNLPAVAVHFQEIGHAIEGAAANANARCVIHFL